MTRTSFPKISAFGLLVTLGILFATGCGDDECEVFKTFCINTGNSNECPTPAAAEAQIRKENPGSNIVSVDSVQGPVNGPDCCYATSVQGTPTECDPPIDITPGF